MNDTQLYPELLDYIFEYYPALRTEKEKEATWYRNMIDGIKNSGNTNFAEAFKSQGFITADEEIIDMLKDGFTVFARRTATRIFAEHKQELRLNLCPKCGKIARTPTAKQCRFCLHSWREETLR